MFNRRPSQIFLTALLTLVTMPLPAAEQDTEEDKAKTPLDFDIVVVTGVGLQTSKMQQSISISTLESYQLTETAAGNAAELLRFVPGVRAESSAGEGNANVTVRGAPISAGGSRYVQWQEDGLPVLLFGDIAFATADQFFRIDSLVDYVEVVRGGFAATAASNSPGGIVNVISQFDIGDSGQLSLQSGIDSRFRRLDIHVGRELNDSTQLLAGGYYRVGDGGHAIDYDAANGGQLKLLVQHQWPNGSVRLIMKSLDDKTPTFLPTPSQIKNGEVRSLSKIDPRVAYFIPEHLRDPNIDGNGDTIMTQADEGLHIESDSMGIALTIDFDNGWLLENHFRQADRSGRFIGLFPANNGDGPTPDTSATFTATLFNTALNDLGNRFDDLRVRKTLTLSADKLLAFTIGAFLAEQDVALTWYWNQYTVQMRDHNPQLQFLRPGYETWGGCCVRDFDVRYRQQAPYLLAQWSATDWNIEGSVRREFQQAFGRTIRGDDAGQFDPATRKRVDYSTQRTAYSWGANYRVNDDLSLFLRDSEGFAYSADRLLYGKALDGSLPIDFNQIHQYEAGLKWRYQSLANFITVFRADTDESNYEATTQRFTANRYRAEGVEWEMSYQIGAWQWHAGLTLTDAEIKDALDASTIGNQPRRQAKLTYQLMPAWRGDSGWDFSVAIVGTGKSFADDGNQFELPAFHVINVYTRYPLTNSLDLSMSVNNVRNRIGFTEAESDGHAARSISGRVMAANLVYRF